MKHPPYHLRTNKAVDRLLLVDIIHALGSESNFSDFTYYSLAGPFLEDLRIMDHFFSDMPLISIESNEQTWKRQKFNQFCSRLELKHRVLHEFLHYDYEPTTKDIFWLDFTNLEFERFNEFQQVLTLVPYGSIVRITLRAEADIDIRSLNGKITDEEYKRLRTELVASFEDKFEKVLPPEIDLITAFEKPTIFVQLVQSMVKIAASQVLDTSGSEVDYLPVQSTYYNDNTQMISVTGIVCLRSEMESMREKLESVRFSNFDWRNPDKIDVPTLTVKERLHLERFLPILDDQDVGQILFDQLGYAIDNGPNRSKSKLSHYAECHRSYPNFVQISI